MVFSPCIFTFSSIDRVVLKLIASIDKNNNLNSNGFIYFLVCLH